MKEIKTIFFLGQKPIGERCFYILLKMYSEKKIKLVVCTNKSKDVWWNSNKIYEICLQNQIPVIPNEKRNTFEILDMIDTYNIDWIISVQHSWILEKEILEKVDYKALNLHLAKLPDYKGYNSFNHAILNKEKTYGVSLHWMTEKVDEGIMAYYDEFKIKENDTAHSLYLQSVEISINLFYRCILDVIQECVPKMYKIEGGTFYKRDSINEIKAIQDTTNKAELFNIVRACYFPPFEPAYMQWGQQKIFLLPEKQ